MATNMAPHNLGETVDAITAVITIRRSSRASCFKFIPGPDFPPGGIIYGRRRHL